MALTNGYVRPGKDLRWSGFDSRSPPAGPQRRLTPFLNDMVISIVVTIIGVIVGFFILIASLFRFMGLNNLNFTDFGSSFNPSTIQAGSWRGSRGSSLWRRTPEGSSPTFVGG